MNETLEDAIKKALEDSETLNATNVQIINLRSKFDIDANANKVRVEIIFDLR